MDPVLLAALAKEGIALAVKLTSQAVEAGAMTQAQADQALADAQANWGGAYAGWKDARKTP